jgi:Protein of unknown function (DUF2863)
MSKKPRNTLAKKTVAKSIKPAQPIKSQDRLLMMSDAICKSASRAESEYWQVHLESLITELLDRSNSPMAGEKTLVAALEKASKDGDADVIAVLMEACETVAQTAITSIDESRQLYQITLFSIPIIAWSTYEIPTGEIKPADVDRIHHSLGQHILAPDALFGIAPFLFSEDQIPEGFAQTRQFMQGMADAVVNNEIYRVKPRADIDVLMLPADPRFILGVALVRYGQGVYRWQDLHLKDTDIAKQQSFAAWLNASNDVFSDIFKGCDFERGMPRAFFHNLREADKRVRPYTLRAVVGGMQEILNVPAKDLAAVVALVADKDIVEYRVSILHKGQSEVINGVVWPLYGVHEDDEPDADGQELSAIEAILEEQKLGEVIKLDYHCKAEYCDDDGAPLFFNADGESMRVNVPDDLEDSHAKYH